MLKQVRLPLHDAFALADIERGSFLRQGVFDEYSVQIKAGA